MRETGRAASDYRDRTGMACRLVDDCVLEVLEIERKGIADDRAVDSGDVWPLKNCF